MPGPYSAGAAAILAPMSDGSIAVALTALALVVPPAWMAARLVGMPSDTAERLVGELRLAQTGALFLVFVAGAHAGLAIARIDGAGAGLEIALATGLLAIASSTMVREPPDALVWLAVGFLAHAVLDLLHRPGLLPDSIVPGWFVRDCAAVSAVLAGLCYLPRRKRRG